ncbi:MAG: hypothetical protein ACTSW4_00055 [Candidatus Ranarchaeia archaeon]
MKAYDVMVDGELKEVEINNSVMTKDKVLLVVDDKNDRIYIWKGAEANVRKRFIGTRHAAGIRLQKGLEYKVESIDQDDEPNSFRALVGKPIRVKTPEGTVKTVEKPPEKYDNVGPLYTGKEDVSFTTSKADDSSRRLTSPKPSRPQVSHKFPSNPLYTEKTRTEEKTSLQQTLESLKKLDVPPGYHREVILIGHDLYSITERRRRFFGKDTIERDIERISQPPEGTFFASNYTPRIIIQNGEVIAIEFLKGTPDAEPIALANIRKDAEVNLSELVGFFQKIGKKSESDTIVGGEYDF